MHTPTYWIPNYPTFRYFAANEENQTDRGYSLPSEAENLNGLMEGIFTNDFLVNELNLLGLLRIRYKKETIDFLTNNPPKMWPFSVMT